MRPDTINELYFLVVEFSLVVAGLPQVRGDCSGGGLLPRVPGGLVRSVHGATSQSTLIYWTPSRGSRGEAAGRGRAERGRSQLLRGAREQGGGVATVVDYLYKIIVKLLNKN